MAPCKDKCMECFTDPAGSGAKPNCNEENGNGTQPVLLAALQCNSDVQLPYRLPICEATHDDVSRRAENVILHPQLKGF